MIKVVPGRRKTIVSLLYCVSIGIVDAWCDEYTRGRMVDLILRYDVIVGAGGVTLTMLF